MWELSDFDGGGDKHPVLYIAPIRYEYQLPEDGLPFVRPYAAEEMGKLFVICVSSRFIQATSRLNCWAAR